MIQVREITSLELAELQPYRTMRRQHAHREAGIFVAEGEKVVRRLLASSFGVVSVLMPRRWLAELEPLLAARPEPVQVFVADKALLETLTGFSMYQGLLAVGKVPAPRGLDELVARAAKPGLLAAVDGLSSAENVGALVRNCAAFNADGLVVGETSGNPFLRRAVRSSMGTIFELPVVETDNLVNALNRLRELRIRIVAAHPHAKGKTLPELNLAEDACLVFGSEGDGVSAAVQAVCDDLAAVPMSPAVDSLNVGSAAAVFFYEAMRQRGRMSSCR